jgi:VWFA-related protein
MRIHSRLRAALPPALAVSALLAALIPLPVTAQSGSDEQALFVSAFDRSGAPVDNLGPDAFIVKEDGAAREVLRVARATEPIAVTVIADTSQAASDNTITQMRTALPAFIDALTPEHAVSLVGLADRPTILVPFTKETAPLTKAASGLFALRNTGATLLDALFEVAQGLSSRDYERAAIVAIVAEGPEHTNRYSKDVVAELKKARASVHLVTIGTFEHDPNEHAARERSFLLTAAPKATGGGLHTMLAPTGLPQALEKVARELTSQYKVVYARPQRTIPPENIDVTTGRQGLTVRGTPARVTARKGA